METVKSNIARGITERHGECVVQMDGKDLCMRIRIRAYEDYMIYVRPSEDEARFLCHYARYDDMVGRKCFYHVMLGEYGEKWLRHVQGRNAQIDRKGDSFQRLQCRCEPAEVQAWRQSKRFRLVRIVKAPLSKFASVAIEYVDAAVQRITTMCGVEPPRAVMTFAEARLHAELYPRPKRPQQLPPPLCKRNRNLFVAKREKVEESGAPKADEGRKGKDDQKKRKGVDDDAARGTKSKKKKCNQIPEVAKKAKKETSKPGPFVVPAKGSVAAPKPVSRPRFQY